MNPRRSIAAALGWSFSILLLAGGYAASHWLGDLARTRLEAQTGALYRQYALQISNALDHNLHDRMQWIRASADLFAMRALEQGVVQKRAMLERLRLSLPDLAWVGYATWDGRLRASSDGRREGERVLETPWFANGRVEAWVGEVDAMGPPAPPDRGGGSRLLIDLAAPVRDVDNGLVGVLVARLSWSWAAALESEMMEGLRAGRPIESVLLDRNGRVRLGPHLLLDSTVDLPGRRSRGDQGHVVDDWPDGGEYVAGYAVSDGAGTFRGLGWTTLVREPTSSAFADARALEQRIFVAILALCAAGALVSVWLARGLTRDLVAIARSADAIHAGSAASLVVPTGEDEAARIGRSLRTLVEGLQAERAALRTLNAELDARVAARTREVERMSDENRHAAVVRERLRMARDLHDTLAHSLAALLTEIRVLRKVAITDPAGLDEELQRAEAAALTGLREAREAITALRHNEAREFGLGAALDRLFRRFGERAGVPVEFTSDRIADALADSRAETLYRIAEEALHNIERHAGATCVRGFARLRREVPAGSPGAALEIEVHDDGAGFRPDAVQPGRYGVRGMREQADLVGATFILDSTPGKGTRIQVVMPL